MVIRKWLNIQMPLLKQGDHEQIDSCRTFQQARSNCLSGDLMKKKNDELEKTGACAALKAIRGRYINTRLKLTTKNESAPSFDNTDLEGNKKGGCCRLKKALRRSLTCFYHILMVGSLLCPSARCKAQAGKLCISKTHENPWPITGEAAFIAAYTSRGKILESRPLNCWRNKSQEILSSGEKKLYCVSNMRCLICSMNNLCCSIFVWKYCRQKTRSIIFWASTITSFNMQPLYHYVQRKNYGRITQRRSFELQAINIRPLLENLDDSF